MPHIEYSRYCVAFLDILGFKNLIGTESANTIHGIFRNIRHAKKLIRGNTEKDDWWSQIVKKTKIYFFSDSIVIAIPMTEPMAFELVASHCMLLQHTLWFYCLPTWIRGGIAIGDLYCGRSEVFGPALIDAYTLEGTIVRHPRIVMRESTYQTGINNSVDKEDIKHNILFGRVHIEIQLIVNLQNHSRLQPSSLEAVVYIYHSYLNYIGCTALDWSIHGIALGITAHHGVV